MKQLRDSSVWQQLDSPLQSMQELVSAFQNANVVLRPETQDLLELLPPIALIKIPVSRPLSLPTEVVVHSLLWISILSRRLACMLPFAPFNLELMQGMKFSLTWHETSRKGLIYLIYWYTHEEELGLKKFVCSHLWSSFIGRRWCLCERLIRHLTGKASNHTGKCPHCGREGQWNFDSLCIRVCQSRPVGKSRSWWHFDPLLPECSIRWSSDSQLEQNRLTMCPSFWNLCKFWRVDWNPLQGQSVDKVYW